MSDTSPYPVPSQKLLIYAALLGIGVGCVATAYYFALQLGFWLVGFVLPGAPAPAAPAFRYAWIVTAIGGLLVALTVRWIGPPSSMNDAIDEIHRAGQINYRKLPAMLITSLLSISVGSSVGPESPMLDISGGVGSWSGDRLKLSIDQRRILTFCGMGAGAAAFFGSPVGSAIFVLEIPHRRGLEYYEAILPTLVSSTLGYIVFRCMTGTTIGGEYIFPTYVQLRHLDLLYAFLLGAIGAFVAALIVLVFRGTSRLTRSLSQWPLLLNLAGGLGIGLIALEFPLTLFFGEAQIQTLVDQGPTLGAGWLLLTALAKIFAFSISLNSGFRGGYVFVLFFVGAAVGEAVHLLIPAIPEAVSTASLIAAVATAVIKAPIGLVLIVAALFDTELIPIAAIATTTSFLLTSQLGFFLTQRSRQLLDQA